MTTTELKQIRLVLARTEEHPAGSTRHGYDFVAPLDDDGRIDADLWRKRREECRVRRFWGDEEEIGRLVHRPGGSWAFRYDLDGEEDDEAGYRFGAHRFVVGEYVSIRDEDGDLNTFRVAAVDDV